MALKFQPAIGNPNTLENSDEAFKVGGVWERNGGREQTKGFARTFHANIKVPMSGPFTVLDVGCALGDALHLWHRHYPQAVLFGIDISPVGISRARQEYGTLATFMTGGFEDIQGMYDVIYCSNVLEHFEQNIEIAKHLLEHCRILYVMTPYAELEHWRPITPKPGSYHVGSFFEDSFDDLTTDASVSIETHIVRCPGIWSPTLRHELFWHLRYLAGWNPVQTLPGREIIYTIARR